VLEFTIITIRSRYYTNYMNLDRIGACACRYMHEKGGVAHRVAVGRVVSSEISGISGGIFPEISGKITVLFRNNSAEKRTCQTPSYFRTMSTF